MAHWWNHYPWRIIQPNFREIDTLNFDKERFLQELESFSCNAVMLNAAGLIASYDTYLEDHQRSAYLDGFDLRHLMERCHEKGIKVIARTDFSKIPVAIFERHPDWAYRHADGTELNYNGYVQTCLNGGYQGAYMDEIIEIDPAFFSIKDKSGELMKNLSTASVVGKIMAKARASRGDVAKSTTGNKVLEQMLKAMPFEAILKQAGANVIPQELIRSINDMLQKVRKE